MKGDLFNIGDRLVCPENGAKATLVGFSEFAYGRTNNFGHEPGIYANRHWVVVLWENDQKQVCNSSAFELADQEEHQRRLEEYMKKRNRHERESKDYLRPLPETPFWEDDRVLVAGISRTPTDTFTVLAIDYLRLNDYHQNGRRWWAYTVSTRHDSDTFVVTSLSGSQTFVPEKSLVLIERGRIWKYYHNESIAFDGIVDEAWFFQLLGHTTGVRNPKYGLYQWTVDEVFEAIRQGLVHGFSRRAGFFGEEGWGPEAIRYRDEELGRRVAKATLAGERKRRD